MFYLNQRTIYKKTSINGIGLHSGDFVSITLKPAKANSGIIFIKNGVKIPAHINYAKGFEFSTTIENQGEKVQTIEHIMASLYLLGIDNLIIEINGDEVPILDGSASEFINLIKKVGIKTLNEEKVYAILEKDIYVEDKDKFIEAFVSDEPIFTFEAKYNNQIIGNKRFTFNQFKDNYNLVSPARTYCFYEEVEFLKSLGLAKGGSLENAVVFKEETVLNPEGLRFDNEPVRHKLLDLIGDLYLLGYPLIGNIHSFKGGHALNAKFVRKLIEEKAFSLKKANEISLRKNIKVA